MFPPHCPTPLTQRGGKPSVTATTTKPTISSLPRPNRLLIRRPVTVYRSSFSGAEFSLGACLQKNAFWPETLKTVAAFSMAGHGVQTPARHALFKRSTAQRKTKRQKTKSPEGALLPPYYTLISHRLPRGHKRRISGFGAVRNTRAAIEACEVRVCLRVRATN